MMVLRGGVGRRKESEGKEGLRVYERMVIDTGERMNVLVKGRGSV